MALTIVDERIARNRVGRVTTGGANEKSKYVN